MFDNSQFFSGARGFYPLTIDQSLRFNDNDSAYLSRTPATAGNRKTWTWSGWVKRGNIDINFPALFGCFVNGTNYLLLRFDDTTDILTVIDKNAGTNNLVLQTSSVYRDVSSWYHIVLSVDTTQATASDRAKLYVNGTQVTAFSTATYPSQNFDTYVNTANQHNVGSSTPVSSTQLFDGYLAEVHFTDGTAYDANAFGEFKSGVWVAKTPSVTYGTNGFYLDFANSADIGNDVSGEGNDWTPNNFTASDVVLDSPTDNFATLNPLVIRSDVAEQAVFSDGNLKVTGQSSGGATVLTQGTMHFGSTGKYYFEVTIVSSDSASAWHVGIDGGYSGSGTPTDDGVYYREDGDKRVNGTNSAYGASYTAGDVIGVAVSIDDNEVEFFKNNVSQGVISHSLSSDFVPQLGVPPTADQAVVNFGQLGFTYTPPTGYLALSTANLPDPVIDPAQGASPEDYFNTVLYTGNGSTDHNITGVGFQPDFVWLKERSSTSFHQVLDAVRGAGVRLETNVTDAETTPSPVGLSSFDADGFTVENNNGYNESGQTYVAWNWKANGSGVANTDGSITSTVSANTTSGFSIVSYTGNGTAGATVGHGLDSAPEMVIVKSRDSARNWLTGHNNIGWTNYLWLDSTNASAAAISAWQNTAPTSSVFSLGGSALGNTTEDYIAYCFHSVEGFSKFGSYVGNGSSDGPFVYCGFRPAFVLYKEASGADSGAAGWVMWDSKRNSYNALDDYLLANSSAAEGVFTGLDFLSNGFKVRNNQAENNGSGDTYIYMAFAENPFKYSLAR